MKTLYILFILSFASISVQSQNNIGINNPTPDASAALDIVASDKGILIPRMTSAERDAITNPATGLMVFVNDDSSFYFFDGTSWSSIVGNDGNWSTSGNNIFSNASGNVGIGNSNPQTKLFVDGDDGVAFKGTLGNGIAINQGAGTRFMWYPKKAAIRAGDVNGSQWDDLKIGEYSAAFGRNVNAHGKHSVALNRGSEALGENSTAIGRQTISQAFTSFAMGRYNVGGGDSTNWIEVDPLFEIGIGADVDNRANAVTVLKNGRVGIGNISPQHMLDVEGRIQANSIQLVNGATDGFVLISNANGVGSWQAAGIGNGASEINHLSDARTDVSNLYLGENAGFYDYGANGNTGVGIDALHKNTTGLNLTAVGEKALYWNTTASANTAIGFEALYSNNTGKYNQAFGTEALYSNTTGEQHTAVGYRALNSNTVSYGNTAVGYLGLFANTTGGNNTAVGDYAMHLNVTGSYNTAIGSGSLSANTGGMRNTACGGALSNNTEGDDNVAVGRGSLSLNTTGNSNTAVGKSSGTSAAIWNNTIAIGFDALATSSDQARIGNSAVSSIGGYANWTNISDARFKTNVQENVSGLDFIMKLRPVTYNLDMDAIAGFNRLTDSLRLHDSEKLKEEEVQIGFIAQEVEAAAKELNFDFHGVDTPANEQSHYGLRYAEFVVPLVKAVQELSEQNENQQTIIKELQQKIETLLNNIH